MRAATIRDGSVVVEEHPDPEPGAGEILVRVHAAGLNGADMLQRKGAYPAPPGWPQDIPGMELAGEVVALGPGTMRFDEGNRVMAIVGGGAQAELALMHEREAMPVPEALDWPAAGGFPEGFTTAHDACFTQAGPPAGGRPPGPRAGRRGGRAGGPLGGGAGARGPAARAHGHTPPPRPQPRG